MGVAYSYSSAPAYSYNDSYKTVTKGITNLIFNQRNHLLQDGLVVTELGGVLTSKQYN